MTHVNTVHRSNDSRLVAVGNDFGLVELFGLPNGVGAKSRVFKAHSEHGTSVRWSSDDRYLYSAGGYDMTIMQWRVLR
jgi:WD40 repeat protein